MSWEDKVKALGSQMEECERLYGMAARAAEGVSRHVRLWGEQVFEPSRDALKLSEGGTAPQW
jgi:hypothetical protein